MTVAYDPWACNFISITNCTSAAAGVSLLNPKQYPEEIQLHSFVYPARLFSSKTEIYLSDISRMTILEARKILFVFEI